MNHAYLCRILQKSTSVFRLLVVIFAWKWCGADLTRWVRPWVALPMTISRLYFYPPRAGTPSRGRHDRWALEHTCATPQPDMRVCDRSHAHGSRPWTTPDYPSHQAVMGRRPTGLTVTFSRPFDGPVRTIVARHRGDSKSHLSLNRRELAQLFVAWAQKRDLALCYITHIANAHV